MEGGSFFFLTVPGYRATAETPTHDLLALARALASSRIWPDFRKAALVVRAAPEPLLGVAGVFDTADIARLQNLQQRLSNDLPRMRHIGYAQAQEDCLRLAAKLRERFGDAARDAFHYTAIPRGGHIVLGMLSYALDLRAERLAPPTSPEIPLVVVDDCALSGARFKGLLPGFAGEAIVFATLYAPPDLRRAIVQQEARVLDCLSAHDLTDEAPKLYGERYADWCTFQRQLRGERGYWYGDYAPFGFAWNEPDVGFRNPVTGTHEVTWSLLPPEKCLKNRVRWIPEAARIQENIDGPGPIVVACGVLHADFGDTVLVGRIDQKGTGQTHVLDGLGAEIWRALIATGDTEPAQTALQAMHDVDAATLGREVRILSEAFFIAGLLERRGAVGALSCRARRDQASAISGAHWRRCIS